LKPLIINDKKSWFLEDLLGNGMLMIITKIKKEIADYTPQDNQTDL
jgi:hypothetical protein